ncbi:KIR protein [Plasmodium coatneyi]|uniref:KIR protein n=1 Tax=Plasmodium coatneyi TaxID=208452 RepID=A0A1B1E7B2_9APIC|nr:KIR protein [Plasmodium coatneyi]ANQ10830.1 KIR protein [Plasmodium coatneyi]
MTKGALCNVNDLPSKQIYQKFEQKNGKTKCPQCNSWADGITSILEDKLRDEWEDWEYATEIAQAWCLISKLNTEEKQPSSPCKEKLCNFFYFWLGGTLCHRLKPSTWFQDTMQEIYTKLKGSNVQCEYIPIDGTIDRDLFKYRKIIFDYYYDYKTLKEQLKYPPSEVSPCKVKYDAYLQDVEDAHKQVEANCGRTSKDEYCNNFWNKFKNSNIPKPPDLKSNIMNGEDITEDGTDVLRCLTQLSSAITELSRQEETSASLGTISSTAISSALGTVGVAALPIVAFLSYKVST